MMVIYTKLCMSTIKAVTEPLVVGWQSRRAWWFAASTRTREEFARTSLGNIWLGLSNLLTILTLAFVYANVFRVPQFNEYVLFLGLGLVIWNSIAGSLMSAPNLFRRNRDNIINSNKHPIFYSLAEWAYQVQTLLQSIVMILAVLSFLKNDLFLNFLKAGILPMFNLLVLIYWLPLLICMLGTWFDDIAQLMPTILQLLFLVSPILYDKKILGQIAWVADINPLYWVLDGLRHSLLTGSLSLSNVGKVFLFNIIGLFGSLLILRFQRRQIPFLV